MEGLSNVCISFFFAETASPLVSNPLPLLQSKCKGRPHCRVQGGAYTQLLLNRPVPVQYRSLISIISGLDLHFCHPEFGRLLFSSPEPSPLMRFLGLPLLEPYTCGACGIQFQFYNNLLEHMQSHAGESLGCFKHL